MRNYQTKSNTGGIADTINTERLGAGEFNSIAAELENAVTSSDQTLAPADGTGEVSTQLAMAMAIYGSGGATYCEDTGAANAYVLDPVSPKEAAPDYFDGQTITFVPGNPNTGASTVNYNAIGAKSITLFDGTALSGGEIDGIINIRYDLSNDRFYIIQSGMGSVVRIYKTSTMWTKPDGLKFIEVMCVGGGGGGGGCAGATASDFSAASGGGGGGTAISFVNASSLSASETVTIGAGGAGGSGAANGTDGGTTSFGAHCSVTGGAGGIGDTSSTLLSLNRGGSGGGTVTGDIACTGDAGGLSVALGISVVKGQVIGGKGGSSAISGGPTHVVLATTNGNSSQGIGSGGGGAVERASSVNVDGGSGADGICVVREYY